MSWPASPSLRALLPVLFLLAAAAVHAAQERRLTLEQALGEGEPVSFGGRAPAWSWDADGVRLRGPDGVLYDAASGEVLERPAPAAAPADGGAPPASERRERRRGRRGGDEGSPADRALVARDLATLEGLDEEAAKGIAGRLRARSADGTAGLYGGDDATYFHRAGEGARRLEVPPESELLALSPDGRHLAFVLANDLVLLDTADGRVHPLTAGGGPDHLHGKLDWVYQEEVYGRGDFQAFWWSPDSTRLAFLSLDETAVHDFTVVDHIEAGTFRVREETTRYPKAGDPNPAVGLSIAAPGGDVVAIDLASYAIHEPLVVRVEWTPSGDRLLFVVQDRVQKWADLNAADPATGAWRTLIHEQDDTWTERPPPPRWLADGSFLWFSDRTDHRHLYRYAADGTFLGALTAGDWSVGSIIELSEDRGELLFTASKDGAVNGNVYRVGLDGTGLARLTAGDGQHSIEFNAARTHFLDRWSSLASPPSVRLCAANGEIVRELGQAELPAAKEYLTSRWELVEIEARDGYRIDAAVMKPAPFDPARRHPVWISTYSGPDAPSVSNRWDGSVWNQFLAQQGFVLLEVNVRSASGKGHWAIEQCYGKLGVSELSDLEDAVDWLCRHEWADPARVGITGHSYGGFMTAFALTHSDRFALGIAGSGVYDWGMYDTIYTERYMNTPQANPEGYKATSVVGAAKDLKGHLVLLHGEMDDNVHMQNVFQLVYALQRAGRMSFEMMIYPQNGHGIGDPAQRRHSRLLEWEAMRRHLLGAGA
ncbi:MAG: DPP IV N-terminal domain-containing protein [Planctomycetota bacterium]